MYQQINKCWKKVFLQSLLFQRHKVFFFFKFSFLFILNTLKRQTRRFNHSIISNQKVIYFNFQKISLNTKMQCLVFLIKLTHLSYFYDRNPFCLCLQHATEKIRFIFIAISDQNKLQKLRLSLYLHNLIYTFQVTYIKLGLCQIIGIIKCCLLYAKKIMSVYSQSQW